MVTRGLEVGEVEDSLIQSFRLDLRTRSCVIDVAKIPSEGQKELHVIEMFDIAELRFRNGYPGEWDVVEITECIVTRLADGVNAEFTFWGPEAGLDVHAAVIRLDDKELLSEAAK